MDTTVTCPPLANSELIEGRSGILFSWLCPLFSVVLVAIRCFKKLKVGLPFILLESQERKDLSNWYNCS